MNWMEPDCLMIYHYHYIVNCPSQGKWKLSGPQKELWEVESSTVNSHSFLLPVLHVNAQGPPLYFFNIPCLVKAGGLTTNA